MKKLQSAKEEFKHIKPNYEGIQSMMLQSAKEEFKHIFLAFCNLFSLFVAICQRGI